MTKVIISKKRKTNIITLPNIAEVSMKKVKKLLFGFTLLVLFAGCTTKNTKGDKSSSTERIFLYGEAHSQQHIIEYEIKEWQKFYNNENMRHLFIENSYTAAQFLNQWMQKDNDDILLQLYEDWEGTAAQSDATLYFFREIKRTCPETIFHGTNIGHQYNSNGKRYLQQLEKEGLKHSEKYKIAEEGNNQGIDYYEKHDCNSDEGCEIREQYMVDNFIRELDSLPPDTKIMGVYGTAHVCQNAIWQGDGKSMIYRLRKHYGNIFTATDISYIKADLEPLEVVEITVNEKTYKASYFGEQNLTGFRNFSSRKYWRLENAYDDFANLKRVDWLPQSNYPTKLHEKDVFRIEYTLNDNTQFVNYMVCFGDKIDDQVVTWEMQKN